MRKLNQSELKFSVQKTLFLFNKNLSIQGIAKERQIKESTVWQHLAELIKFKQIPLRSVVSDKKIRRILSKVYSKKDKLKEIKRRLKDDSISYDEIYCVLASIK
ncbi:MAG: helix-turn-helix domain-containing protein [Nanoarchaeota archaeon]|nr:helix-turn-helix domain-containing protein [Nanoarchaeota archaeon]MBU1051109.1 helix-turn-helix domain-containing protein [Nanoarchaeota archaeon]MBU1987965.1 helix-turn-helix domain-containing protein [Nanoarchaeota archaeon]